MLECTFCKRIPKEGCSENLNLEIKEVIKEKGYKYFKCDCENEWLEVDNKAELFDLNLFNRKLKTFEDFNNLIIELEDSLEYYHLVSIIKDCLNRINNWVVTDGDINDAYIERLLNNLNIINL